MSFKGFTKAAVRVCADRFALAGYLDHKDFGILTFHFYQAPQSLKQKFNIVRRFGKSGQQVCLDTRS